jgi:hypothetical protein
MESQPDRPCSIHDSTSLALKFWACLGYVPVHFSSYTRLGRREDSEFEAVSIRPDLAGRVFRLNEPRE